MSWPSEAADTAWYEELFLERGQQHLAGSSARSSGSGSRWSSTTSRLGTLPAADGARSAGDGGISRMLIVPLVLQARRSGPRRGSAGPRRPPFSERDIEFAQAAAGSVAAAVVHARLRVEENVKTANQVRDHLARELHDAVTQSVYSASLIAQALPTIWQRSPGGRPAGARASCNGWYARHWRSCASFSTSCGPASLVGVGLDQLLDRLGDSLAGQADVSVKIGASIEEPPPQEVKEALYRIAQEAFNNIAKHARASNVVATVVSDQHGVFLEVQDDGVGMDAEAADGDHMGLAIMSERAEEIGARVQHR